MSPSCLLYQHKSKLCPHSEISPLTPGRIGDHHIRAVPRWGATRAGWRGARAAPAPARTQIPNIGSQRGDFQPARWTVVPTPAGTMCHHAGKNPAAAASGHALFVGIKYGLTVSGSCPARTGDGAEPVSATEPGFTTGNRNGPCVLQHHSGPCDHCGLRRFVLLDRHSRARFSRPGAGVRAARRERPARHRAR